MIFDKTNNWERYFNADNFYPVFEYIKGITVDTPDGNYVINDNFYIKVMSYSTSQNPKVIESHRREVDIQIVLEGSEKIKVFNFSDVEISEDYNKENDCVFYKNPSLQRLELCLGDGYMAVFFPEDIHQPAFSISSLDKVIKKIVIKANANLFS